MLEFLYGSSKETKKLFKEMKAAVFPYYTRADIVFTNNHESFFSWLIKFKGKLEGDKALCNHCEIYSSGGRAISADMEGIQLHNMEMYFNGKFDVYFFRCKFMDDEDKDALLAEALRWTGKKYDFLGIVWQALDGITRSQFFSRMFNKDFSAYCSEFVQKVFYKVFAINLADKAIGAATPFDMMQVLMESHDWECVFVMSKEKGEWYCQAKP